MSKHLHFRHTTEHFGLTSLASITPSHSSQYKSSHMSSNSHRLGAVMMPRDEFVRLSHGRHRLTPVSRKPKVRTADGHAPKASTSAVEKSASTLPKTSDTALPPGEEQNMTPPPSHQKPRAQISQPVVPIVKVPAPSAAAEAGSDDNAAFFTPEPTPEAENQTSTDEPVASYNLRPRSDSQRR